MGLETDLAKLVEEQPAGPGVKCLLYKSANNPTVAVHGSILAGTSSEPSGKSGLAELTSRLLIRGTRKLGAVKVADLLESVGAAISFRNSQDSIIFQARMTSPWTKRVLGVVTDCLTRPALSPRDIEREREGLLTDIRLRDDDTTRRGMGELQRIIYPPGHPYRKDRFGTAETVKDLDRSDVKDYFENVISPAPALISFAGQFKKDEVVNWAARTFGTRNEKKKINSKKNTGQNSASKSVKREIVMPHKTQGDILIGGLACSRTEPDYEPLNLMNVILGELGFMGRLGQRVRDKEGLAYSCTSFLNAGLQGGNWTALAGVNPKNVDRAKKLMEEEIKRVIDEPVLDQELEDAKENQTGSALMELESTEGVARTSHNLVHYGLGLDYFAKRRQLFRKINKSQLQEMAGKYLQPSRTSSVIVGPKAKA